MEYSKYYLSLSVSDKEDYIRKLRRANVDCDPYCVRKQDMSQDMQDYPPITYPSMCNYLVASPNPDYNFESMMSHKSL